MASRSKGLPPDSVPWCWLIARDPRDPDDKNNTNFQGQKKTVMCDLYDQQKCTRGAWCTFAHGPEELGMPIPVLPPGKKNRTQCEHFLRGACKWGEDCLWIHNEMPSIR